MTIEGNQMNRKGEQKPVRMKTVTGAIIVDKKKGVLMVRRAETEDSLPGFWELPGGEKKEDETEEECLKREVKEELGLDLAGGLNLASPFTYELDKGSYIEKATQINFIAGFPSEGKITLSPEHSEYAWVKVEDLDQFIITTNIKRLLREVFPQKHD